MDIKKTEIKKKESDIIDDSSQVGANETNSSLQVEVDSEEETTRESDIADLQEEEGLDGIDSR